MNETTPRVCDVAGCGGKHKGNGLCDKHLHRFRKYGTTVDQRPTFEERFWSKVDKNGPTPGHAPDLGPCWLWTAATNEHGYGVMRPEGQRTGPTVKAHRVAVELGRDPGECVRHRCDNPPCVNPAHLSVGTKADNTADMVSRDRHARGSRSGTSKLTEGQVAEIRGRAAEGELHRHLAAEYSVSRPTVTAIVNGKGWTHVR